MGTRRELRVERPHVNGPLRATVGRIPADQRALVTSSGHRLVSTLKGMLGGYARAVGRAMSVVVQFDVELIRPAPVASSK